MKEGPGERRAPSFLGLRELTSGAEARVDLAGGWGEWNSCPSRNMEEFGFRAVGAKALDF